jgi:hypothetical protein
MIRRGLQKRRRQSEITRALAHLSDEELLQAVRDHGTKWCAAAWGVDRPTVNNELRLRGLEHPHSRSVLHKEAPTQRG